MRDYGKVHTTFWSSGTLKALDADAKLLALYLLTSPHTTMTGAFRLPDAYACEDLGWDTQRFRNSIETLSDVGFVKVDSATRWLWIVNFTRFNKPENPNVRKAAIRAAEAIPASVPFRSEVVESLSTSERVSEPLRNTPSPSPSPSPSSGDEKTELSIPLNDGSDHVVSLADLAEFEQAYPKLDVEGEIRKARAWCVSNPASRKTPRGVGKFLNGWLSRAADRPSASGGNVVSLASQPGGGRRAL